MKCVLARGWVSCVRIYLSDGWVRRIAEGVLVACGRIFFVRTPLGYVSVANDVCVG